MKIYKIFYILGLMFMALFFLSTLNSAVPLYALLSLVSFIISGKYYKEDDKTVYTTKYHGGGVKK